MHVVAAIFLLGVVLARVGGLRTEAPGVIDALVVRVALPALVLDRVSEMSLGSDALVPVATAWCVAGGLAVCVLAAARLGRWERATTGALLLVVPLGNTSFLGLPAIGALLGDDHLGPALVYDQLGSFLLLVTYGTWIAARYGTEGEVPGAGAVLARVVRFPPFPALVVALVANPFGLPEPVHEILAPVGAMVGPLALLGVGMRARLPSRDHGAAPVAVGLGLRMLLAPAAVLGVGTALDASGAGWSVAVLQAGMPPMVTAGIVATEAGLDERAATLAVSAGLVLALGTLPLWAGALPW